VDEIEEHFEMLKQKRLQEKEKQEQLLKDEASQKHLINNRLRYNERINLNRKGATASFKSMTRAKRNHIPDGKGEIRDEVPDAGQYPVKYNLVEP